MAEDVDYMAVASITDGMVGAELANIIEIAAINMMRDGRTEVVCTESEGIGDNRAGLASTAEKLEQAENQLAHSHFAPLIAPSQKKKEEESQLAEITRDSAKITVEQVHGLMSQRATTTSLRDQKSHGKLTRPLVDFLHVLSFAPRDFNFIEHTSNTSWKEYQRIVEVIVDPGLYLASKGRMFTGNKKRTLPNAYRFFTGSPHVILSRKLVEFAILGWDNLPRKLLLFFSNTKYSQGDYFQTLACNSKDFSKTVVNSNLRFSVYEDDPRDLSRTDLEKMLSGGAAFAGNFRANDPVLDKIDSLVLHRTAGMILPGGWCLGGRGRGRDPCQVWGDMSILRPGPASEKFEKLLLSLMSNTTFHSNQCVR